MKEKTPPTYPQMRLTEVPRKIALNPELRELFKKKDVPGRPLSSGTKLDQDRSPEGFRFASNIGVDDVELIEFYLADENYIVFAEAYDANGGFLPNHVTVFVKEGVEPVFSLDSVEEK